MEQLVSEPGPRALGSVERCSRWLAQQMSETAFMETLCSHRPLDLGYTHKQRQGHSTQTHTHSSNNTAHIHKDTHKQQQLHSTQTHTHQKQQQHNRHRHKDTHKQQQQHSTHTDTHTQAAATTQHSQTHVQTDTQAVATRQHTDTHTHRHTSSSNKTARRHTCTVGLLDK